MSKRHFLSTAVLLLAGASLWAGPFDTLFSASKRQWPETKSVMVACNIQQNQALLKELVAAAKGQGLEISACNVAEAKQIGDTLSTLGQFQPDLVVVVDTDPVLGGDAPDTKDFIKRVRRMGLRVLSTGEKCLQLGAVLAAGPSTEGKLVASSQAAKSAAVKVEEGMKVL